MDKDLTDLFSQLIELGFQRILVLALSLYSLTVFKGFIKSLANKAFLFFDKNIVEDRLIKLQNIEGRVIKIGFRETKIENGENIWYIPNSVLVNSIKGFPIQKKHEETEEEKKEG